jgi:hypothetical protein
MSAIVGTGKFMYYLRITYNRFVIILYFLHQN